MVDAAERELLGRCRRPPALGAGARELPGAAEAGRGSDTGSVGPDGPGAGRLGFGPLRASRGGGSGPPVAEVRRPIKADPA